MAKVLAGLLCRFIGARFVASFNNIVICSITNKCSHQCVQIKIKFFYDNNFIVDVQCTGPDGVEKCAEKKFTTPIAINDEDMTCSIASILCPFLVNMVMPCYVDPGLLSLSSITDFQLVGCIASFTKSKINLDGMKRFVIGKTTVVFWPKYISFKRGEKQQNVMPIPIGINSECTEGGQFVFSSGSKTTTVDAFVVLVCQAFVVTV